MRMIIAAALVSLGTPLAAQTALLTASPIPEGAETRFCYYAGLAYSEHSYLLLGGNNQAAQMSGGAMAATAGGDTAMHSGGQIRTVSEQKPLECKAGDDGILRWQSVATLQISK